MPQNRPGFEQWYVKSSYQEFVKREGAPLYEGSSLEDLTTLPLAEWERRGGRVAYTRLADQEKYALQIVEIPSGGELKPEHQMYEAIMFVLKGRGATTVWQEGEPKRTVEWEEGSLLGIPLNAWHQEFNSSGSEPCRFVFDTNMPLIMNLYNNLDFVFHNPYVFRDRYSSSVADFFTNEGTHLNYRTYETNFIPDVRRFAVLDENPARGYRHSVMRVSLSNANVGVHIADVAEGTYMTAHRHAAGARVIVVGGQGYELLFMPGEEKDRRKIPLKPYAVISPKHNEFHQHFNTGGGPFRMLAFRGEGIKYGWGSDYSRVSPTAQSDDPHAPSFNITYEMEDPSIREEYYRELERNGISSRLPPLNQRAG